MFTNRLFRLLGLGIALIAAPVVASADVLNFTVNGTATQATNGYTVAQAVSFTFTLKSFGVVTPFGRARENIDYLWREETLADPELFASVSGTGLSGTWKRPDSDDDAPSSLLQVFTYGELNISAGREGRSDTGLMVNGSDFSRLYFTATFIGLGDEFDTITGTLPDPTAYFGSNLIGTYLLDQQFVAYLSTAAASTNFTITSLTISAVPEPSSYAAMAGAAGLFGAVFIRRRRAT
jgi:hypothetical protein